MNEFSKEFIFSVPKIINFNGCWIPQKKPNTGGYVEIVINGNRLKLHRVVMCLWNNINYYNHKVDTRHDTSCNKACFNPEHLKPGSASDNQIDSVRNKTHHNTKKEHCSCGRKFSNYSIKSGPNRGKVYRICKWCKNKGRRMANAGIARGQ